VSYLVRISVTKQPSAPKQDQKVLDEACGLFRQFHCFDAPRLLRQPCQRLIPKVVVHLGELRGLIYRSARRGFGKPQTFVHFLETPAQLTCDVRGRQLYILGGRYRVTRRGIEG
jgi:hypothetical protein